MGKKRIHELAKELSMTSAELLQRMADLKILTDVKLGPSHSVDERVAEDIKGLISGQGQLQAAGVVVRRRKKTAEPAPEAAAPAPALEAVPAPRVEVISAPAAEVQAAEVQAAGEAAETPAPAPETAEGPAAAPQTRKVTIRPEKPFEKATIIGVRSPQKPQTPAGRGRAADPRQAVPDFLKLSPTRPDAPKPPEPPTLVPAPEETAAVAGAGADAARIPQAPETTAPGGTVAPQPAPEGPAAVIQPPSQGPAEAIQPGPEGQAPEAVAAEGAAPAASAETARGESVRVPSGEGPAGGADTRGPRPPKSAEPPRKVTRELGPGTMRRAPGTSMEPARVVGNIPGYTPPGRPTGPRFGVPPRPGEAPQRPGGFGAQRPGYGPPRPGGAPRPAGGPPRPGGRPEPPAPPSTDTRKRGERKRKTGGFGDKPEDANRPGGAKRRDLVERTDLYPDGAWERGKRKSKLSKKAQSKTEITTPKAIKRRIKVDEVITVSELAHRLSLKAGDIIKRLMGLGVMAGLNQSLDFDTATLVAAEFGYEVEKSAFDEDDLLALPDVGEKYAVTGRPPVVTIMGHVDHGKTSLLDYIRKTKIQEGEAGGITQHIGAYHVKVGERYITFLDTPGHEAFTAMRSRGAQVTDLVILIVAADDGVMPQTREAADHARAAKVPIIVAVNKVDKPGADPERIRRQMMELGLTQESWGGDTVFVDISAKTGQGVEELLEMILLQSDLLDLKARADGPARGRIIEARLDKGRGAMATVLVGEGLLKQGDIYVCGAFHGKVRALLNDQGQRVASAGPAIPVEIQGVSGVPQAGDEFIVMEDDKQAKQVSQHRLLKQRESELVKTSKLTLENLFDHIKAGAVKGLNLIVKADVQGSLEAILDAVGKLSTPEIKITVIHSSTGAVSETDIMLASASKALVIAFGLKAPGGKVSDVAEAEQVQVRYYDVIYKLLDDIKEAMAGLLDPIKSFKILGQAEVRAVFTITKVGVVAGSYVSDGKVTRGCKVRLYRDGEVVYDGRVATLKREKTDVREVLSGFECGVHLEGRNDVQVGDRLEFYQIEETAATVALINEAVERAEAARSSAAAEG